MALPTSSRQGSFTEGRIAGKAAVNYVNDLKSEQPQVSEKEYDNLKKVIFQPLETYRVGRNEIVAGTVSPSYMLPMHGLQRLEKIMDEYVGRYRRPLHDERTHAHPRGWRLLAMLKEDLDYLGAEDLHQLQRAWELHHRVPGLGGGDASHDVQDGDAVAGILLSSRSSDTG